MNLKRICPNSDCTNVIMYKSVSGFNVAEKAQSLCKSCACRIRNLAKTSIVEPYADFITEQFNTGRSILSIATEIDLSSDTVRDYAEKVLNLPVRRNEWNRVNWIDETTIRCSACEQIKSINQYRFKGKNPASRCILCQSKQDKERWVTQGWSWSRKLAQIKYSAQRREIPFSLSASYLEWLWDLQNGRCVFTGVDLELRINRGITENSVSVDRISTDEGYTSDNVEIYRTERTLSNTT